LNVYLTLQKQYYKKNMKMKDIFTNLRFFINFIKKEI